MGEIGAVEEPYPCLDEAAGVVGGTRRVRQGVQRAEDPHTRRRGTSDQVVGDRIAGDVGPLVDACVERKRGSLGSTEMDRDGETVRVGFVDDCPKHLERGDRPRL